MNRHISKRWRVWPAIRAWCDYNTPLIELVESGRREVLILSFVRLMESPEEFQRLERFVGTPLEDPRDPKRHRSRGRADVLFSLAMIVRRLLRRPDAHAIHSRLEALRLSQSAVEIHSPVSGDRYG